MPTYVYECPEHGQVEVVKPMADSRLPEWCMVDVPAVVGTMPCLSLMNKVISTSAIHAQGRSGDGYFLNRATGMRSSGKGKR